MPTLYSTTPTPPETYEVIEAVQALLVADSELENALGGSGRIYAHDFPDDLPGGDDKWRRGVVKEPVMPGGRMENVARYDFLPIHIVFEIERDEDRPYPDPRKFLSHVHARVFELIVGNKLNSLTLSAAHLPIERWRRPHPAHYDPTVDSFFSSAEYRCLIKPIDE